MSADAAHHASLIRRAMRFGAIDEWRRWNAKKRIPPRLMVSLDEGGAGVSPVPSTSAPPGTSAKLDADYLIWYLERHGLWLSLYITLMVMAGYSQREAAAHLGVPREHYRDYLLPRWQGLCQLILSE